MYIVDDICYAGEETPDIKVKEARALWRYAIAHVFYRRTKIV